MFNLHLKKVLYSLVKWRKRSSAPSDPIPVPFLGTIIDSICPAITVVINSLLVTDIILTPINQSAIVKPILKKAGLDQENLANYRVVPLRPFF